MRLNARERTQLAAVIGCEPRELVGRLRPFFDAANEEYLTMMLGQRVFTRGQDIREYRLFLLIKHAFNGALPDEGLISKLFQTTTGQSRSLLRAVMSKYQYELQDGIEETLRATLRGATQDGAGGPWVIATDSENRVDALNRELWLLDARLPVVSKRARTVATYEIANSAYEALRRRFGL